MKRTVTMDREELEKIICEAVQIEGGKVTFYCNHDDGDDGWRSATGVYSVEVETPKKDYEY